eukprot:TRINITY_DN25608_c0_g1_i1.p1 TRINITY_DN25608_c0_g1~~TRINITY_DN25608_c0_g1_i1.p1  ORF type:complete len:729 (-),score=-85.18 TRINITY_DN25608_c0_g1_i1:34-2220(-)
MAKKIEKKEKENIDEISSEQIILQAIEESKKGSPCAGDSGVSCSSKGIDKSFGGEKPHIALKLTKEQMIGDLRNMMLARYTDDKHLTLVKQGKSFFHIGGSGHEGIQTAVAAAFEKGVDWGWTYYRDLAFSYGMGYTPKDYFLLAMGKPEDPATGGKQMPGHYGHPGLNLPTQSSSTGMQYLNAVGSAMALKKDGTKAAVYVASGEGTTSQGEFYEAVNWASRDKLPVLFCVQDNGYAISVPREHQSMGSNVGHTFCCYQNLKMISFKGYDYFESTLAAREAVEYIKSGKGPVLLHADVVRLLPHSSSDDHKKYRPEEELKNISEKDCIKLLSGYLVENKISTLEEIDALWLSIKSEVDEAVEWCEKRPDAKAEDSLTNLYAPEETRNLAYASSEPTEGSPVVLVDAVNHALKEEMAINPKMLIFGEDVADPKGGVFTATRGLTNAYGQDRVFNSPLAEASIIGVATGLAVNGYKPVVEIQFGDYIWPAFMQIKNEMATMRYRSNGGFKAPVVIRVAVGGYIHGGLCHSQNIEGIFSHIPGLYIAYPSNAMDAKGLLKTACRIDDPVLFLEHKGMYRLPFARTVEPNEDYLVPFGKGKIVKEGEDAVIVTYGMGVKDSLSAVKTFEKETGKSIRIVDLRTIAPWDKELVLDSVKKTGRLLVVHEDTMTTGFGAEISATVVQQAFKDLDAPIMRIAAKDSFIPYAPAYEEDVLPNETKILAGVRELLKF